MFLCILSQQCKTFHVLGTPSEQMFGLPDLRQKGSVPNCIKKENDGKKQIEKWIKIIERYSKDSQQ